MHVLDRRGSIARRAHGERRRWSGRRTGHGKLPRRVAASRCRSAVIPLVPRRTPPAAPLPTARDSWRSSGVENVVAANRVGAVHGDRLAFGPIALSLDADAIAAAHLERTVRHRRIADLDIVDEEDAVRLGRDRECGSLPVLSALRTLRAPLEILRRALWPGRRDDRGACRLLFCTPLRNHWRRIG